MKRREFLKTACLASACLLSACKSTIQHVQSTRQGNKLVAEKTLFNTKTTVAIAHEGYSIGIVKLDNNNFAASKLICSHRGCAVTPNENGFICPCHGARFDKLGQVTKGPAEENLVSYITSTDQQFVYIQLSE